MQRATKHPRTAAGEAEAQPAWAVALLFPNQGDWTETDNLALTDNTNPLAELVEGRLEVLPMPTIEQQRIVCYLFTRLSAFVERHRLGEVLFAPLRVRMADGTIREPDVVFLLAEHAQPQNDRYWEGADLVMEVVREDARDRERDLVEKRREYAQASIREYWIVDPQERRVTVLTLPEGGDSYDVHGEFSPGQQATSKLLPGFEMAVVVFAAGPGRQTGQV